MSGSHTGTGGKSLSIMPRTFALTFTPPKSALMGQSTSTRLREFNECATANSAIRGYWRVFRAVELAFQAGGGVCTAEG